MSTSATVINKRINMRLPHSLLAEANTKCEANRMSLRNYVTRLLMEDLEKSKLKRVNDNGLMVDAQGNYYHFPNGVAGNEDSVC